MLRSSRSFGSCPAAYARRLFQEHLLLVLADVSVRVGGIGGAAIGKRVLNAQCRVQERATTVDSCVPGGRRA